MPAYGGSIRFGKRDGKSYPFTLSTDPENDFEYPLSRSEVESLRDDLDNLLNPQESVVQVHILGRPDGGHTWGYVDPSGELQVGDLVRVPFGHNDLPKVAIVRSLGRGAYTGWLKSVLAKFTAEEL